MSQRFYYGWRVVAGGFLAQMLIVGFTSYSLGHLVEPIEQEFASTRAQVMAGATFSALVGLFFSPFVGQLADRWSLRWLLAIGAALTGGGLLLTSMSRDIVEFTVGIALTTGFGMMLLGPLTVTTMVTRWFTARRGRAMGIAAIGTSVGGMLMPLLVGYWLDDGWRSAVANVGWLTLLVIAPAVVWLARDRPESVGLQVEGTPAGANERAEHSAGPSEERRELNARQILRHPQFWVIGLAFGLLFHVHSATLPSLVPFATGMGIDARLAYLLVTLAALMGMIGKLLFGVLADSLSHRLMLWIAIGLTMVAIGIYSLEPPPIVLFAGVIAMGLSAGGMLPVWGLMLANVFGMLSYGRAMGVMTPLITITVVPSFVTIGKIYDEFTSYTPAFLIYLVLLSVSALLVLGYRPSGSHGQTSR